MRRWLLAAALLTLAAPAYAGSMTLPAFAVQGASACPDDDGAANAPAGAPNYPAMLDGYKATAHDLGCKVAGVDYHAGVPDGLALKDPTTAPLPAGCAYDRRKFVTCSGSVTLDGYDFGLHGTLLAGSGKTTVKNSRFVFGADCTDPVVNTMGSLTLIAVTIDGTLGFGCNLNQGNGAFVTVDLGDGDVFVAQYNSLINVAQDGFDMNAGSSGRSSTDIRFNVVWREGSTGHPDFLQWCGGGAQVVSPNVVGHNTFFNDLFPTNTAGIQPLHVEAQICTGPGHLDHSTVALNTVIAKGSCDGGHNWPPEGGPNTSCSANFLAACKLDDPTSSNNNFIAYGNYGDVSGAIWAFADDGCPGVVWGKPLPNVNMLTGAVFPISAP